VPRPRENRLSLHRRGRVWYVSARPPGGRARSMSLALVSPQQDRQARALHKQLEAAWKRGEMIFPEKSEKAARATLGEAIDAFVESRRRKVTERTLKTDSHRLKRFAAAITARAAHDISRQQVEDFLDQVLAGASKATHNQYLFIVRGLIRFAIRRGWRSTDPTAGIAQLDTDQTVIEYLTIEQRAAVLRATRRGPYGAMIATALFAGLRAGELRALERRDIFLEEKTLRVRKSKTRRERSVPLDRRLLRQLKRHLIDSRNPHPRAPVFSPDCSPVLGEKYRQARTSGPVRGYLENYLSELGRRLGFKVGWNIFRHTFGSLLAQDGVSLYQISAWMGNSPEVCRRHYAALRSDWSPDIEVR